jgi:glycosyltransferase involved in cell wall biosynthesis
VDDGSGPETRAQLARREREFDFVRVHALAENGGKGAALKAGYALAAELGFTHALQLDADGQHEAEAVPRMLEAMQKDPGALVLGEPVFDQSAPRSRIWARQLSRGAVWLATLSFAIRDPLCGMRGVPLGPALRVLARWKLGSRMELSRSSRRAC